MRKKKKVGVNVASTLFLSMLMLLSISMHASAQNGVRGKVFDTMQEPLIGVSVQVKGTTMGVITNIDGEFTIGALGAESILVFSYLGYTTQEKRVGNQKEINITLAEDDNLLNEIVVIGYGSQKRSDLTGGIATLSGDKLNNIPAVDLSQRLQGQVAGMSVTLGNAKPGEAGTILIRGKKTLKGSTSPLIVLDGIPFAGSMTEIDQNSIESISILKDASSAAIYGARATNGVILITTKKGVVGKPTVRYSGYVGVQKAQRLPNMMKPEAYVQFMKDYRQDTKDPEWNNPEAYLQTALLENFRNNKTTDWVDMMFQSGLQMEHQLSVSGATENTNYYVSFVYSDQESIIKESSGYKKYAVTTNISQNIGQYIKVGTNIQLSERDRGGQQPRFEYGLRMSPFASARDEDGKYIRYPMYGEVMYHGPYAEYGTTKDDKSRSAYLNGFAQVDMPWIKGLSYRANMGSSYRHRDRGTYYPTTTMTGEAALGKAIVEANNYGGWTWENVITYTNSWQKHNLNLTGLYSAEKLYDNENKTEAQDFISDANLYHNMSLAKGLTKLTSNDKRKQLLAYMLRINYSYDSRYLLTLTGRRDGASVYGKGNKWEFFPSVATAWVISEEAFFKNLSLSAVDHLKLRVSYGSNGNIYSDPYKSFTKLTDQDYIFGNAHELAGGLISGFTFGNPNLKWEKTDTYNVGLDFYLFNNSRVRTALDIYSSTTNNLLMTRTVPVMNGYTSVEDNVGKVQNRGVELTINSDNIVAPDFKWSTTVIFAKNKDKIIELQRGPDGKKLDDISNKWFIGKPVSVWHDYKVIGIWQESEKESAAKFKAQPGDAKLWDNGDDKITADDRVVIGSKAPEWTMGMTNTFAYKNLSLSLFFNGIFGAWHQNETIKYERQLFGKNINYLGNIDYWTASNPSNQYTRLGYLDARHNFYKKVDIIRLQDVNLAYKFPKTMLQKIGMKDLTTYISSRNLLTLSNGNKYTTNAEQEMYSLDSTGYPVQRTFIFGVNLTF